MSADNRLSCSAIYIHRRARGYTLIEVLVVVAIVATLGGLVVHKISDAMHRSENANALQRKQAVYTAEAQYTIAAGGVPDDHQFSFQEIQPWLTINGNPVQTETDLMKNTGNRTMNFGTQLRARRLIRILTRSSCPADLRPTQPPQTIPRSRGGA